MTYNKKTLRDMDVSNQKVLLRCDLAGDAQAALPTLRHLLDAGAAVIVCAGEPGGEALCAPSMAAALGEMLGCTAAAAADAAGPDAMEKAAALQSGQLLLLEDLGSCRGEGENDPGFAKKLASMAQIYVNDSIRTAHLTLASTVGAAALLPSGAGLLLSGELERLEQTLGKPSRSFAAVLGGAPTGGRIDMIDGLLDRVSALVLGGGLANTFLKARGGRIGSSLWDAEKLELAAALLEKAKRRGVKVFLPLDSLAANEMTTRYKPSLEGAMALFEDKIAMDIGPRTVEHFRNVILRADTVLWSGPMGVIELPDLRSGTRGVLQALADTRADTVVCGRDTAQAAKDMGFGDRITHISAGGDAVLAYAAGSPLPGAACLADR